MTIMTDNLSRESGDSASHLLLGDELARRVVAVDQ